MNSELMEFLSQSRRTHTESLLLPEVATAFQFIILLFDIKSPRCDRLIGEV